MMRKICLGSLLILVCATGQYARAETVFVIDRLLVGVHKEKRLNSEILKVLPTGTELEVLERSDDLVRIKSPDGVTGWVDSSYLTSNKPAQLLLQEVQDELEQLKQENERLKQQAASERLSVADLQAQLSKLQNEQAQSGSSNELELQRLRDENTQLKDALLEYRNSALKKYAEISRQVLNDEQTLYYLIALLFAVLLAFLCGLQMMDWLQRRRHGGFRI
jgi:SH3 domain protein